MAGLDTDDLNDLENRSTDAGTDFSGNIDASYEKPALDIANADSSTPETKPDTDAESTDSGPKSTFNYKNDTKNKKKKSSKKKKKIALLVGSGGGFLMLAVLIIFMANMLKIPNLAQHIAEYNMFSVARTFNKTASQSLAEKFAVDAEEEVFQATLRDQVKESYLSFRGSTWGKLDKYRPQQVIKNLGKEGDLNYIYTEKPRTFPFTGNKLVLESLEIKGQSIALPEKNWGHYFENSGNKINFSGEIDAAIAASNPEVGFFTRGRIAKRLMGDVGVELNFWQKAAAGYKGLKKEVADRKQLAEEVDRVHTTPSNEGCAVPQSCAIGTDASDKFEKAVADENKPLIGLEKESLERAMKTNPVVDAIQFLGGAYAIALPVCIIYDASIVKAKPVIESKNAALQKTYYGLMTAADQQKSGQTNAVAVGAMNNKLGDITGSLPEQRAYGRKVSTKNFVAEPDQPQNGGVSEDISIADLLGGLSGPSEKILDTACPTVLDAKTAIALTALQVALGIVSGGSGTAAEEGILATVKASITKLFSKGVIDEVATEVAVKSGGTITADTAAKALVTEVETTAAEATGQAAAKTSTKLLSKFIPTTTSQWKSLSLKLGRDAIIIGGGSLLAKYAVLAHMGGNTTGLETDSSYANRADMGGNLAGNDIHRQALMGRPLDEVEQIASRAEDQKDLAMITSRESAWNRYLAIGNIHSLISRLGFGMLNRFGYSNTARFSAIRNIFSFGFIRNSWGFIQNMSPGHGIVSAAASQTDNYGIIQWGWTKEELDLSATDHSYGIIINDEIYNRRTDKKDIEEKYSKCFTKSMGELLSEKLVVKKGGKIIEGNEILCTPKNLGINNTEFKDGVFRYRLSVKNNNALDHLLDVQNVGSNDGPQATGANSGGIVGDTSQTSVDVACATGTNDLGIGDGYSNGQLVKIRLCSVPGLPSTGGESTPGNAYYVEGAERLGIVNSRVSGAVLSMITSALSSNIAVSATSTFRSMIHQESMCADGSCDGKIKARAGFSNHQMGLAIDFVGTKVTGTNSVSCAGRAKDTSSPIWNWLYKNAEQFGFKQYSMESWHWDTMVSPSRCGSAQ